MLFSTTSMASMQTISMDTLSMDTKYAITVPYEYPIVPGMDEWADFKTLDEMIAACQIPDKVLSRMSTDALVETVVNYPLAINMFAYSNYQSGFDSVMNYCNGFQELYNRTDSLQKMEKYLNNQSEKNTDSEVYKLKNLIANTIMSNLVLRDELKSNLKSMVTPEEIKLRYEIHYNYTPNGSRVSLIFNMNWSDHPAIGDAAYANVCNEQVKRTYPNATSLREENPAYNCHSYAWYSTSSGNLYWMNSPWAYMTDGSYTRTYSPTNGDKVCYESDDHSAIYIRSGVVHSKWGAMGVYQHAPNYSPYDASQLSYWER